MKRLVEQSEKSGKDAGTIAAKNTPGLPLRKKLLFPAFTLLLILEIGLQLELSLAWLGVEPAHQSGDPLVGFSRQLPHFVEREGPNGEAQIVTAAGKSLLNQQSFPKEKSSDAFRIVRLRGETTYGHPSTDGTSSVGWLRFHLTSLDPGRRWEIVNAGGVSYASYRVLLVMEELGRSAEAEQQIRRSVKLETGHAGAGELSTRLNRSRRESTNAAKA